MVVLAAFAFFKLPVGKRTPFEHVIAIAKTEPAKEAGRAVFQAILDVRRTVVDSASALSAAASAMPSAMPTATNTTARSSEGQMR